MVLGEKADNLEIARGLVSEALENGSGLRKFRELVFNQEGDASYIDSPEKFPLAPIIETVSSPSKGFLEEINAQIIGETSVEMGAGRVKKEDKIDHRVGIIVHRKVGDFVNQGGLLFTLHARDKSSMISAKERILKAHKWSSERCEPLPLFYEVIM
jgi:pyrimidine-nucleoside phosphorylase